MADLQENCGCKERWSTTTEVSGIDFCPLHKAAPEMRDALEGVLSSYAGDMEYVFTEVRKALAQARGQEVK